MEKLTAGEKQRALDNIDEYYDHLNNQKYCKQAATYLADKSFEMNMMTETTFSHDSDLEEAVIGACMIERAAMPLVADKLRPEMFYEEKNLEILPPCNRCIAAQSP